MSAQILARNSAYGTLGLGPTPDGKTSKKAKNAWAAAQNFEQIFVKNLYGQAFQGLNGEGPLGTVGTGTETWRDLLVGEYANATTKAGGIGIAKNVYRELLHLQEGRGTAPLPASAAATLAPTSAAGS